MPTGQSAELNVCPVKYWCGAKWLCWDWKPGTTNWLARMTQWLRFLNLMEVTPESGNIAQKGESDGGT